MVNIKLAELKIKKKGKIISEINKIEFVLPKIILFILCIISKKSVVPVKLTSPRFFSKWHGTK